MKKDCTDAKVFLEERLRMCQAMNWDCHKCPLYLGDESCNDWLWDDFDGAIERVQKWSDAHPVETIEEHFRKLLPNMDLDYDCICCRALDNKLTRYSDDCYKNCEKCWNRPYKESLAKDGE